jgi:hypothetical protein
LGYRGDDRSAIIERVSDRRAQRGPERRSDAQILAHTDDMYLLDLVRLQQITLGATTRMDLRRLARDELILIGFGHGARPTLLPRGERLLAAARGEFAVPEE